MSVIDTWKLNLWLESPSPPPLTSTEAWPLFSPPLAVVSHTILQDNGGLKQVVTLNADTSRDAEYRRNKRFCMRRTLPWGDLISAVDDRAGDTSYSDRVLDVFSFLSKIGTWDGHNSTTFYWSRDGLHLQRTVTEKFKNESMSLSEDTSTIKRQGPKSSLTKWMTGAGQDCLISPAQESR